MINTHWPQHTYFLLTFFLFSLFTHHSHCEPIAIRNLNPFIQVFGLPAAKAINRTPPNQITQSLTVNVVNAFSSSEEPREHIHIDGETARITYSLDYSLNERSKLGIAFPFVHHGGGVFDGFIEGYHDAFGFPQGGRDDFRINDIDYRYTRDDQTIVHVNNSGGDIGDLRLTWQYLIKNTAKNTTNSALNNYLISTRAELKLPTGNARRLLGSESTDLALSVQIERMFQLINMPATTHISVGALFMSNSEVIDEQQRHVVAFATVNASIKPRPWLDLTIQLDSHSRFYHSRLDEIGDSSLQITLGGTIRYNNKWQLRLGLVEDLSQDIAPDVTFHSELIYTFQR